MQLQGQNENVKEDESVENEEERASEKLFSSVDWVEVYEISRETQVGTQKEKIEI